MFQKLKIPIIIVITALVTQLADRVVEAAAPSAFLPAGTIRLATAASSAVENIYNYEGWQDLPGMTKYVTIPGGQVADVVVTFCAAVSATDTGRLYTRAFIGGSLAAPSSVTLKTGVEFSSHCAVFYKTNVAAGSPSVRIQVMHSGGGATAYERSMVVIANIH
jgi:hypothetical protein